MHYSRTTKLRDSHYMILRLTIKLCNEDNVVLVKEHIAHTESPKTYLNEYIKLIAGNSVG